MQDRACNIKNKMAGTDLGFHKKDLEILFSFANGDYKILLQIYRKTLIKEMIHAV